MILAVKAGMGVPHLFQADIKKFPLPRPPVLHSEPLPTTLMERRRISMPSSRRSGGLWS